MSSAAATATGERLGLADASRIAPRQARRGANGGLDVLAASDANSHHGDPPEWSGWLRMDIAFVVYDGFTALDLVGPYEVMGGWPGARVPTARSGWWTV